MVRAFLQQLPHHSSWGELSQEILLNACRQRRSAQRQHGQGGIPRPRRSSSSSSSSSSRLEGERAPPAAAAVDISRSGGTPVTSATDFGEHFDPWINKCKI